MTPEEEKRQIEIAQEVEAKFGVSRLRNNQMNIPMPTIAVPYEEEQKQVERKKKLLDQYKDAKEIAIDFQSLSGTTVTDKFRGIYDALCNLSKEHFRNSRRFAVLCSKTTAMLELCSLHKERPYFQEDEVEEIKFFGSLFGPRYIGKTTEGLYLYEDACAPHDTIMLGDDTYNENGQNNFIRISLQNEEKKIEDTTKEENSRVILSRLMRDAKLLTIDFSQFRGETPRDMFVPFYGLVHNILKVTLDLNKDNIFIISNPEIMEMFRECNFIGIKKEEEEEGKDGIPEYPGFNCLGKTNRDMLAYEEVNWPRATILICDNSYSSKNALRIYMSGFLIN
jgi:hypothetical protein